MARQQLLDYFVSYAQEKQESLEFSSEVNTCNNFVRGCCDILPGMYIGAKRYELTHKINNYQKQICALYKTPNSKA